MFDVTSKLCGNFGGDFFVEGHWQIIAHWNPQSCASLIKAVHEIDKIGTGVHAYLPSRFLLGWPGMLVGGWHRLLGQVAVLSAQHFHCIHSCSEIGPAAHLQSHINS